MKRNLPSMIAGVVLVLILGLYMVTFQVRSTEVAVVSTFGKATKESVVKDPGLRFKWPWPIQRVAHYDNRLQTTSTPGEETSTRDGKTIIISTAVGWRIDDPFDFSIRCGTMKTAEENLKSRIRNDQKTVIGNYDFGNFVSTDPGELKFDQIEQQLLAAAQPAARELYGIRIESVRLEKLALPQTITETVFNAMKKERQTLADKYTSEGQSTAEQIKKTAEAVAGTILSFADLRAAQIVAEGQAAAADANKTFRKDEQLAIFLLKLDNLARMLKERSTIVLDAQQQPMDLLVEPSAPRRAEAAPATRPADSTAGFSAALPEITDPK